MEANNTSVETALRALQADVAVIKSNYATKADLSELRSELRTELADFKREVATEFGRVRTEMATGFGELRADIARIESRLLRWVVTAIILAQLIPTLPVLLKSFKLLPP